MRDFNFLPLRKFIVSAGLANRECRRGFTLAVIAQGLRLASPADALVVTVNSINQGLLNFICGIFRRAKDESLGSHCQTVVITVSS
jgi:hypothetical protein